MIIDKKPRLIPPPSQRLVGEDGLMNKDWYDYFREVDALLRKLVDASNDYETRIDVLEP